MKFNDPLYFHFCYAFKLFHYPTGWRLLLQASISLIIVVKIFRTHKGN